MVLDFWPSKSTVSKSTTTNALELVKLSFMINRYVEDELVDDNTTRLKLRFPF